MHFSRNRDHLPQMRHTTQTHRDSHSHTRMQPNLPGLVSNKTQVPQPFALNCPSSSQICSTTEWPLFKPVTWNQIQQAGQSAFLSAGQTCFRARMMPWLCTAVGKRGRAVPGGNTPPSSPIPWPCTWVNDVASYRASHMLRRTQVDTFPYIYRP